MAYVVADNCVKCKYTDCVAVCPVDCFYEGKNMLAIHPYECIDCGLCAIECPASAIFAENELPVAQRAYASINAVFSGAKLPDEVDTRGWPKQLLGNPRPAIWPFITEQKDPLPGASLAMNETNKIGFIDPKPES